MKKVSKALLWVFCVLIVCMQSAAARQLESQDNTQAKAKELWELAIAAKGGRDKLDQVKSYSNRNESGSEVEFMVFPDRFFLWADTRPSKFGLLVELFNFERDSGFTIWGDDPPDVRKRRNLDPELRSRLLTPQLYYFLETQWFKPELLKAYKDNLNGKRVDVVEARFKGFGYPFRRRIFLDETTHLPVRIGALSDTSDRMFNWVDLKEYHDIAGIKVPTLIKPKDGKWSQNFIEINPDYNPQFFEQQPDMKVGAFQWRRTKN